MYQPYTRYSEAKDFFRHFAECNDPEAKEVLDRVEELKTTDGDIAAARFLILVYENQILPLCEKVFF